MGFRFRKRIKILPGLWLNLSQSGVSTSIGGKGLTVNIKDGETRTTASIPGTGMSYTTTEKAGTDGQDKGLGALAWLLVLLVALLVGFLLAHV